MRKGFKNRQAYQGILDSLSHSSEMISHHAMPILVDFLIACDPDEANQFRSPDGKSNFGTQQMKIEHAMNGRLSKMNEGCRYQGMELYSIADLLQNLLSEYHLSISWFHWVSSTGCYESLSIFNDYLYNLDTYMILQKWYMSMQSGFEPGMFYYGGEKVE